MFVQELKTFILNNPQIVMVTDRGLEDKDRRVIFSAKDLATRHPELKMLFPEQMRQEQEKVRHSQQVEVIEPVVEEPVEVVEEVTKPKKSKKK